MSWPEIDTTEDIEKDVLDFVIDSFRKMFNMTDGKVTEFIFTTNFEKILVGKYETREFFEASLISNKLKIVKGLDTKKLITSHANFEKCVISFRFDNFKQFIKNQYQVPNYNGNYYFIFCATAVNADKRKFVKDLLGKSYFKTYRTRGDEISLIILKTIEVVKDISVNVYIDNLRVINPILKINKSGECGFYYGMAANKKKTQVNIPDHMIAELNSVGISKNSIKHSKAMNRMTRWTSGF